MEVLSLKLITRPYEMSGPNLTKRLGVFTWKMSHSYRCDSHLRWIHRPRNFSSLLKTRVSWLTGGEDLSVSFPSLCVLFCSRALIAASVTQTNLAVWSTKMKATQFESHTGTSLRFHLRGRRHCEAQWVRPAQRWIKGATTQPAANSALPLHHIYDIRQTACYHRICSVTYL